MTICVTATAAAKSRQSCPTLCNPIDSSPLGSRPWDSPGKNTGVGCHFPLQCMKVKSESEVAQLCPTLRNPMDCSRPGSSVHGISQARVLEWGAIAFSRSVSHMSSFQLDHPTWNHSTKLQDNNSPRVMGLAVGGQEHGDSEVKWGRLSSALGLT